MSDPCKIQINKRETCNQMVWVRIWRIPRSHGLPGRRGLLLRPVKAEYRRRIERLPMESSGRGRHLAWPRTNERASLTMQRSPANLPAGWHAGSRVEYSVRGLQEYPDRCGQIGALHGLQKAMGVSNCAPACTEGQTPVVPFGKFS